MCQCTHVAMFVTEMCLGLLCVWLLLCGAEADRGLSRLYGVEGRNEVSLCLKAGEGRRERWCPGAILHEEWVGVSAGCLRQHPQHRMFTLRVTDTRRCDELPDGYSTRQTRTVLTHFYHPWGDLAIVMLHRPYVELDVHPNSTMWTVSRSFKQHGIWKWMRKYIKVFAVARDPEYHYKRIVSGMISTRAPLFAFVFAVLMPLLILALVFFYVIYYTGSPKGVPYKVLKYTKKSAQI